MNVNGCIVFAKKTITNTARPALVQSLTAGYFGERQDRVRMMARQVTCSDQLFKGRRFEREIIILCVRWYPRFN
jgi:hypothetical protein